MSKIFLWLSLLILPLMAEDGGVVSWSYNDEVELRKDQVARYQISVDDKLLILDFRWTLYVNKGLVMLYKLDKFPYQNVMYKDHKLDRFKLKLKNRAANAYEEPYAVIVFKDFDDKTKKATFTILLKDDYRSVQAERVLPRTN